MIVDKEVEVTISNQGKYFKSLGYDNVKQGSVLLIPIEHLQPKSCIKVECSCDECGEYFRRPYQQIFGQLFHRCYKCARIHVGKTANHENTIKATKSRVKENHPNYNPNKSEFKQYWQDVKTISEKNYRENVDIINPNGYQRTLCGVEGGYQLDHIISVKQGFDEGISPEIIGGLDNLQMLPWKENRNKWHK